jgi:hypothetical protein
MTRQEVETARRRCALIDSVEARSSEPLDVKSPARRGGLRAGLSLGVRLGGSREMIIGPPRKARMTELHDIHVIHRTLSTGNLKVCKTDQRRRTGCDRLVAERHGPPPRRFL